MSEKYYPYGYWCNRYQCTCDDVVYLTDGCNECNGDCHNCIESEEL